MKIKVGKLTFNLIIGKRSKKNLIPVIMIHGFGGNANDWNFIFKKLPDNFFYVAVDLIGHGKSASPKNPKYYSAEAIVNQLKSIFDILQLDKFILIGYSMGGRVALSYVSKYPDQIIALILESTSPGIINKNERIKRLNFDKQLSKSITKNNLKNFFADWYKQPIFSSLAKNTAVDLNKLISGKLKSSATGLKNILTEFSPGTMPSYWSLLKKINFPVLLLNGSIDKKYNSINKRALKLLKYGTHKVIKGAGHNSHLEKPEDFIKFVNQFLKKYERTKK
ncbi:2-succinyl-6-hydroxy-2,4-cyclohexadiene-1-carboxylate synthase [Melioribacteraceae bacterium 4301-Me]|uniref:2-succinyl-6-hydroxy-2, 4-cyclohexadiene-1-carboxylate synthase n=1 Tax=Pyranulibacter aquaticus TaxID=3163344 RepID=UPI003598EF78